MNRLRSPLRLLLLACAGVGTFHVASQWAAGRSETNLDELVVQPMPRSAAARSGAADRATPATPATPAPDLLPGSAERARSIPDARGALFTQLSWLPPPPAPRPTPSAPPAPPPKPAEPVAPALPFTFVGMLERGAARPSAFVAKGDALLVISAGDVLENNTYRVESLNPNEIVMTYLPLNTRQALSVTGRVK